MKLLSWNCQGLGNPWTVRNLHKLVKDKAPTVCFLMETRLDRERFDWHCRELPYKNKLIIKKPDTGGGIALIWKPEVNLDVINFTENHVLAKVVEADGFEWYLTGFYGWPEASQKHKSWALLKHLLSFVDGPWLCIGDFNAMLSSSEKQSRCPPTQSQMDEFRMALDFCGLADLGFVGFPFTWNNKRPGCANTKERLDRAVASLEWREKFQDSTVYHLSSHASDHIPLLLETRRAKAFSMRGPKGFRFEEAWLLSEECEAKVRDAWNKASEGPSPLVAAQGKIASCGEELRAWGASRTHPDSEAIKKLQKQVEWLNTSDFTEECKAELLTASRQLDELLLKQEIYWAQRSRVAWLKHGDKNTKFFHTKASQRQRKNYIQGIKDKHDRWVEEVEDIGVVASDYFENMFRAGRCDQMADCLSAVPNKVTANMKEVLTCEYTAEEVRIALFQMGPTKAPGLDGMNALFY